MSGGAFACRGEQTACAEIEDAAECAARGCEVVTQARKWTRTASGECTELSDLVTMCADSAGVEDSSHSRYFVWAKDGVHIVSTNTHEGLVGWESCESAPDMCTCPSPSYCAAAPDRTTCLAAGCTRFFDGPAFHLSDAGVCAEIALSECLLNASYQTESSDLVTRYRRPAAGGWEVIVVGTSIGELSGWDECADECPCPTQVVDP